MSLTLSLDLSVSLPLSRTRWVSWCLRTKEGIENLVERSSMKSFSHTLSLLLCVNKLDKLLVVIMVRMLHLITWLKKACVVVDAYFHIVVARGNLQ